jgi:hypothetical protein
VASILGLWATPAWGEERPEKLPSPADLDGIYLTLGPVGALTRVDGEWLTAVGGEVSVVKIRERCFPAAGGLSFGGVSYAGRDGGRLWGEVEVAVNRPLPFAVGLSAGVAVEVDPVRVPRWGWQGTLWIFAGIIPYARIGTLQETGGFVELGVAIKFPRRLLR